MEILTVEQVQQIIEELKQSDQLTNWADDPKTHRLVDQLVQIDSITNTLFPPETGKLLEYLRGLEPPEFKLPPPRPPQVVEYHHHHHHPAPEPTEQKKAGRKRDPNIDEAYKRIVIDKEDKESVLSEIAKRSAKPSWTDEEHHKEIERLESGMRYRARKARK